MAKLEAQLAVAEHTERADLAAQLAGVRAGVRAEKLSELAAEFDSVHSIQRARRVGSVDAIIRPEQLRPRIIAAIEHGLTQTR